jgi:DNA-binding transcriptional MerR regulator/effector-binding domain-containing protein
MLSIGEFSRVTRLTIKALRLYHEKGILVPDLIGESSSYRYYGPPAVERAGVVGRLKDMGFTLDEIKAVLDECRDDREIIARVEKKLAEIERSIKHQKAMKDRLRLFLQSTEGSLPIYKPEIAVEKLPDLLICSLRFKGRYADSGPRFGGLLRACGRKAKGRPLSLYYDGEYKEDDADIEIAVEVGEPVSVDGYACRTLPGGTAITLFHLGSYERLGRSYEKLYEAVRARGQAPLLPIREQYLKGPGLIFRGHPKKYLTKLMVMIAP